MPDGRKQPEESLSRRQLLPTIIGAIGAVTAAVSLAESNSAEAQSKVDKTTAKYQDHPNSGNSCSLCNYFRPPKSCQLVAGDISPNGWCSFFMKKP